MKIYLNPKFFLRDTLDKRGYKVLSCRIYIDRKKAEISTGLYIDENDWNEKFSRSNSDKEINRRISEFSGELQEISDRIYFEGKNVTVRLIASIYRGEHKAKYTITEFFSYYLYDSDRIKTLAKGYSNKFITLQKYLERFTIHKYKTDAYDLRSIDFKFINDFHLYLKNVESQQYKRPLSEVYIYKMHSMFRTILIAAFKESLITYQPYESFTIRTIKTEIKYLSSNELDRIRQLDLDDNLSLDRIRDIFMFSVYTGLRYGDAQKINEEDIEYIDGNPKYLITYQVKTKDKVEIPILKPTLEIIKKYENTRHREKTGRLLPKVSNIKINAYLKVIGDLAKIKIKLTHHVARHTCATTLLLENEVPLIEVSKWLGHTDMRSSKVYAHITRKKLGTTAERLNDILDL